MYLFPELDRGICSTSTPTWSKGLDTGIGVSGGQWLGPAFHEKHTPHALHQVLTSFLIPATSNGGTVSSGSWLLAHEHHKLCYGPDPLEWSDPAPGSIETPEEPVTISPRHTPHSRRTHPPIVRYSPSP